MAERDIQTNTAQKRDTTKRQDMRLIRRYQIMFLILLFLCVTMITSILSTQLNIFRQERALYSLQSQIETQRLENDDLSRIVNNDVVSDDYVERIAREKLGYAGFDERVFVDVAGSENAQSGGSNNG